MVNNNGENGISVEYLCYSEMTFTQTSERMLGHTVIVLNLKTLVY